MTAEAAHIFDTDTIFKSLGDASVSMNGMTVFAVNIQITSHPRSYPEFGSFVFPVYFELTGDHYHYTVAVWYDRAEIEVFRDATCIEHLSTIMPTNVDQLITALNTIAADYEVLLDRKVAELKLKQGDYTPRDVFDALYGELSLAGY